MSWISVTERLPSIIKDEDGMVNCIIVYPKLRAENIVNYEVWNAEYARLHPELYTHWQKIEPPINLQIKGEDDAPQTNKK